MWMLPIKKTLIMPKIAEVIARYFQALKLQLPILPDAICTFFAGSVINVKKILLMQSTRTTFF